MKNINDLTEIEILNLTDPEIELMIKFRKAEEGIKFLEQPKESIYSEVMKPSTKAYYCSLFGSRISFTDMNEMNELTAMLAKCKSIVSIDSNYDLPEGSRNFIKKKPENGDYSSNAPDTINSVSAYTYEEYLSVKDVLKENTKAKKEYGEQYNEYKIAVDAAKWIEDEIYNRVSEVREKYYKLNGYCLKFKRDYLPLANNDETVAMNFINKAYSLTDEEQAYILENYAKE